MSRHRITVAGGAATAALLATAFTVPATATPPADARPPAAAEKADDRPDALEAERRELNQRAAELVVSGDREVAGPRRLQGRRGRPRPVGAVRPAVQRQHLHHPRRVRRPEGPAVPDGSGRARSTTRSRQPDRAVDNTHLLDRGLQPRSTSWTCSSPRTGESFKDVYEELSSGRYTVDGDVTDWVKVPYNEASYGETESHTDMTRFIDDGAEAWYEQQKAAGKTDAEIKAYLAELRQVGPLRLRQGRRLQGVRRLHRPLPGGPRR